MSERGNVSNFSFIERYSKNMDFEDISDMRANRYTVAPKPRKWLNKFFLHLVDLF
jgi:hypothetical protein